jgi:hypothetical protein
VEELRRLALKGVADKLKNPSDEEQRQPIQPQPVEENAGDKNWSRKQDDRNAQRVTHPIYRMLMTGAVLRDPLLVGASTQHAHDDITISTGERLKRNRLKRNLEPSVSTCLSQRKHKHTSRPRQFARPCKGPMNWKALPDLRENFLSYKRR